MRSVICALALCCVGVSFADSALDQALAKPVTLNFRRTPLVVVLDALQERATGLNITADANVLARPLFVTLKVEDMKISDVLSQIRGEHSLSETRWAGALLLHDADKGPSGEATTGKGTKALEKPVSVTWVNLTAGEAMSRLKARYKVEGDLSTRARVAVQRTGARVRLRLRSLRLRHVLDHMCRQLGLEWSVDDAGKVSVDAPRSGDGPDLTAETIDRVRDPQEDMPKLLDDLRNPAIRTGATRRLLAIGEAVAQPAAERLPEEKDPDVVRALLEILAQVGTNAHYEPVLKVFRDPRRSLEERVAAGQALGDMQAVDAIPFLIAALDHTWFSVSETARQALVKIGGPVSETLAGHYKREIGKTKAREGLIYRGLLIFGEIGDETSRKVLLEALATDGGEREVSIKHHAAIGLGMTGDVEVVEPLIEAMTVAEEKRQFQVVNYISRSLTWLTDAENAPRAVEWRGWWEKEKARIRARIARRKELEEMGLDTDVKPDLGGLNLPGREKK